MTTHHHLPAHEIVLLLETDVAKGLASDEAARRLERFGPNLLSKIKRRLSPESAARTGSGKPCFLGDSCRSDCNHSRDGYP